MRYLVTGHTGFKGSWLSLWLAHMGHEVSGIALDPPPGGIFQAANVGSVLAADVRQDIRDADGLATAVKSIRPEVVFHLAAQPLVRESYRDPIGTYTTNVNGTMNLLTAVQAVDSVRALIVITTDKVYRNRNQIWGYRETDPLGGDDPYSASKAMADILTQSWVKSFPGLPTAIARAGNVIGGGDVSPDRLLPDLIEAYRRGEEPVLRYPAAVRPWQHVLDCLNGYITLADALLGGLAPAAGTWDCAWNFGPDMDSFVTVGGVANEVAALLDRPPGYKLAPDQPPESGLLALDSSKARIGLGWRNLLGLREALDWTVNWSADLTKSQLLAFEDALAAIATPNSAR